MGNHIRKRPGKRERQLLRMLELEAEAVRVRASAVTGPPIRTMSSVADLVAAQMRIAPKPINGYYRGVNASRINRRALVRHIKV